MDDNEKQIEIANMLEALGIDDSSMVEEIIELSKGNDLKVTKKIDQQDNIDAIKLKLLDEKDWRKKAILSAMLISKSLD